MSDKRQFAFWISEDLRQYLDRVAWENKMSKGAFINMLLENHRKQKEGDR